MGVKYSTLAPKHPLVSDVMTDEYYNVAIEHIVTKFSRLGLDHTYPKDKIGVFNQGYVIHTFIIEKVHDLVQDYVLGSYGTSVIMAGPAYDKQVYEFSKKCILHIKWFLKPNDDSLNKAIDETFTEYGETVNSGEYDGLTTHEAKLMVLEQLESIGKVGLDVTYKLRAWIFLRHQYRGEPMPIYFPVTFPNEVYPLTHDLSSNKCEGYMEYFGMQCSTDSKIWIQISVS
jgi:leucyl-tRNA synthetase